MSDATALCAVFGLILSSWLSVRTEGNASPDRICRVTTAFLTAYTI